MAEIKHEGIWTHRLAPEQNNPREQIFARRWLKENDEHSQVLRRLVCFDPKQPIEAFWGGHDYKQVRENVTQDEAAAVATVVQWLGSNVGWCFLEECLRDCGFRVVPSPEAKR